MALNVGDAVLQFLGDTTQLDAAFNRVATEAGAKMGVATTAIQGTTGAVDEMSKSMAVGQQGAVELGEMTNLAGEKVKESMYEARGEIGLLGEMFGINLPRHVRSFVAELPGVGIALSAAFQATAVLFLIDALAQAIEKITQWAEHGEKIAQAWEKYDETIFESSQHMQKELDDTGRKLVEMTQGPLAGLGFALNHIRTTAFETFSLITKDVAAAVAAMNEASSSLIGIQFNVFKDSGKDLEKFRLELEKVMRIATLADPKNPFASYEAGIELVKEKERELTELINKRTAASGQDASAAVGGLHAERQAVNDMLPLLEQGIRLQKEKDAIARQAFTKEANKEELHLVELLDKAHKELNKELEKGADEVSKHLFLQLTNQLKAEEKSATDKLQRAHQVEEGEIAAIDGEMRARELATKKAEQLLERQYKTGLISTKQYSDGLRTIYQQEAQDLIAALNRKEALVILEAKTEAALRGKIITDADAKELKAYVDLENKKAQVLIQADIKMEKQEDKTLKNTQKRFASFGSLLKAYDLELQHSGKATAAWGAVVGTAISEVMQAWAQGSITFDQALKNMLASLIQATAKEAEIQGTKQLALGFGSWPDFAAMEQHFAAAALWFALGGGLSMAGGALSGGGGNSGDGAGNGPQIDKTNPNTQPGGQGQQGGRNVPHLQGGGLITQETLALVHPQEAVIPLNSGTMDMLGEAIARHSKAAGNGGDTFYFQTKGLVSADTWSKTAKGITRQVRTGRARFLASDSLKTTRRG